MRNWQWCCSYKWMFVESGGQRVGRFGSWTGELFFFFFKNIALFMLITHCSCRWVRRKFFLFFSF